MSERLHRLPALVPALALTALLIGSAACSEAPDQSANPIAGPQVDSSDTRAYRLQDLVEHTDTLKIIAQALRQAGLHRELQRGGPYTLFAPTDRSFQRHLPGLDSLLVPSDSLSRIRRSRNQQGNGSVRNQGAVPHRDSLRTLLQFHLMRGRFTISDVPDSLRVSTLLGKPLMLRRTATNGQPALRIFVRAMQPARVLHTLEAQNGVLHLLDRPLHIPPPDTSRQNTPGGESGMTPAASEQTSSSQN